MKIHAFQNGNVFIVLEFNFFELDRSFERRKRFAINIFIDLGGHRHHFANAVEAGEGFRDLRADRGQFDDRHRQQERERDVHQKIAQRHRSGLNGVTADNDHHDRDGADDHRRERTDRRHACHRFGYIPKKPVSTAGERKLLSFFRGVRLDDADAAETIRPAGRLLGH